MGFSIASLSLGFRLSPSTTIRLPRQIAPPVPVAHVVEGSNHVARVDEVPEHGYLHNVFFAASRHHPDGRPFCFFSHGHSLLWNMFVPPSPPPFVRHPRGNNKEAPGRPGASFHRREELVTASANSCDAASGQKAFW